MVQAVTIRFLWAVVVMRCRRRRRRRYPGAIIRLRPTPRLPLLLLLLRRRRRRRARRATGGGGGDAAGGGRADVPGGHRAPAGLLGVGGLRRVPPPQHRGVRNPSLPRSLLRLRAMAGPRPPQPTELSQPAGCWQRPSAVPRTLSWRLVWIQGHRPPIHLTSLTGGPTAARRVS
jgi:hypothetical protein